MTTRKGNDHEHGPGVEAVAGAAIAAIQAQAAAAIAAIEAIVTLYRATGAPIPTAPTSPTDPDTPLVYTVERSADLLGIGRTKMYQMVAAGEVVSWSPEGTRRRLIPRTALEHYLATHSAAVIPQPANPFAPLAGLGDAARP